MKKLTIQDFQNRLDEVHPNQNLIAIKYNGNKVPALVKCGICGQEYEKIAGNFTDKRKVSICKNCFPTQPNTLNVNW